MAVTGAGGTLGPALLERLGKSAAVRRVLALGRHETDDMRASPKFEFRRLDVRDRDAVLETVAGADVVVHLAFTLYGIWQGEQELFATNVQGTSNLAEAAVRAGARRFVYTSSAAVYGGNRTDGQPHREDDPLRPSPRLFYARHKAQAELVVQEQLSGSSTEAFIFRPCAIVGPHAAGSPARGLPDGLLDAGKKFSALALRSGLRPFVPPPPVPLQFVHEDDVAQALERAIAGEVESGIYNLAGDGTLDGAAALRVLGLRPLPLPGAIVGAYLRLLAATPPLIPVLGWSDLIKEPLLIDPSKARERLGWKPQFSSSEALLATRDTLGW